MCISLFSIGAVIFNMKNSCSIASIVSAHAMTACRLSQCISHCFLVGGFSIINDIYT